MGELWQETNAAEQVLVPGAGTEGFKLHFMGRLDLAQYRQAHFTDATIRPSPAMAPVTLARIFLPATVLATHRFLNLAF